jgi:hypothetical protein
MTAALTGIAVGLAGARRAARGLGYEAADGR